MQIHVYGYLTEDQMMSPEELVSNGVDEQFMVPSARATELGILGRGIFTVETEPDNTPLVCMVPGDVLRAFDIALSNADPDDPLLPSVSSFRVALRVIQ